jgi:hypothetical protein
VLRVPVYIPTSAANPVLGMGDTTQFAPLLILNPFTDERHTLEPDFPDLFFIGKIPFWGGWYGLVYSQNLEYVVYLIVQGFFCKFEIKCIL